MASWKSSTEWPKEIKGFWQGEKVAGEEMVLENPGRKLALESEK